MKRLLVISIAMLLALAAVPADQAEARPQGPPGWRGGKALGAAGILGGLIALDHALDCIHDRDHARAATPVPAPAQPPAPDDSAAVPPPPEKREAIAGKPCPPEKPEGIREPRGRRLRETCGRCEPRRVWIPGSTRRVWLDNWRDRRGRWHEGNWTTIDEAGHWERRRVRMGACR